MVLKIEIKYEGKGHSPSIASEIIPFEKSTLFDGVDTNPKRISREDMDFYGRLEEHLHRCVEAFSKNVNPQATSSQIPENPQQ